MDDEQVVGVLRRCDVCERKTLHRDGACSEHEIIGRAPAKDAADERGPLARRGWFARHWRWFVPAMLLLVVLLAGFVHIAHNDAAGWHLCWKQGWTLSDTFVDLDDWYASGNRGVPWKVGAALSRCGL